MSLMEYYKKEVAPSLMSDLDIKNVMAVPRVEKVVLNVGIGTAKENKAELDVIVDELTRIAGQRPSVRKAKKSVAGFAIRQGQPVGVAATLRGKRMYDFLEKLFNIVLPRLRDFRGVSLGSSDKQGNYTLGMIENSVFPEIDLGKITKGHGLEITIVTNTKDSGQAAKLLERMGMPFEKEHIPI